MWHNTFFKVNFFVKEVLEMKFSYESKKKNRKHKVSFELRTIDYIYWGGILSVPTIIKSLTVLLYKNDKY